MIVDIHFPRLTVLQTLEFAVSTKADASGRKRMELNQHVSMLTHTLLKIFGLESTFNTPVGNDFVSGVSGGEKKRVSLAEVVSRFQRYYPQVRQ
jgi:ABC-type multidrug transport system ATPase subunit